MRPKAALQYLNTPNDDKKERAQNVCERLEAHTLIPTRIVLAASSTRELRFVFDTKTRATGGGGK